MFGRLGKVLELLNGSPAGEELQEALANWDQEGLLVFESLSPECKAECARALRGSGKYAPPAQDFRTKSLRGLRKEYR